MASDTARMQRHRRTVALAWIALAVVGGLTLNSATGRLTTPGQEGNIADHPMTRAFGIDGNIKPTPCRASPPSRA